MKKFTQVKVYDKDNDLTFGGIRVDDDYIICGCCGSAIEKEDFDTPENPDADAPFTLMETYDCWVNFSKYIL